MNKASPSSKSRHQLLPPLRQLSTVGGHWESRGRHRLICPSIHGPPRAALGLLRGEREQKKMRIQK